MLLDHGHPDAWHYPLPTVADEATLIIRRANVRIATEAIAVKAAGQAIMSGKEGEKIFNEVIAKLLGE